MHHGGRLEPGAGFLRLGCVAATIILGADRAQRDTARIAAALRPFVIEYAIASLREYGERHVERSKHALDYAIEVARRNRRHWIGRNTWRSPGLRIGAGHPQRLLRFVIEWCQLFIADRPIEADPETTLHAKIGWPTPKH